jgi:hypothetical protein
VIGGVEGVVGGFRSGLTVAVDGTQGSKVALSAFAALTQPG